MQDYKEQFKEKKITVMGLGILGRGLGYAKFLAECGADLIVTDIKTKEQLATSVKALSRFKNITYRLGEHRLEDFRGRDMIMKAAGVLLDSLYIREAKKNKIPIEMDVSLFAKCAPGVKIVGITGTRGKSMTTALIYEILKQNEKFLKYPSTTLRTKKPSVFLGGNMRGIATLPLLKKAKEGDILVCELDSWQLQGFGDSKISPHISIFTSFMPDHMNYYGGSMKKYFSDKANIFKFQKKGDHLIIRPGMKKFIKTSDTKAKLIVAKPSDFQTENKECAIEVARLFKIPDEKINKTIKNFKGLEGRLQLIKTTKKGVKIYNDNNATTPEATIAGIQALSGVLHPTELSPTPGVGEKKKIVLICGGADKGLLLDNFVKVVNKHCKAVIMIPGTGTDRLLSSHKVEGDKVHKVENLEKAIKEATKQSKKGDIILFSPAFASFGLFNNEYERNDLFIKLIKKI